MPEGPRKGSTSLYTEDCCEMTVGRYEVTPLRMNVRFVSESLSAKSGSGMEKSKPAQPLSWTSMKPGDKTLPWRSTVWSAVRFEE